MSSPTSRRSNLNSLNGTPRRSARNSTAPLSSDPILPDAETDANPPDGQLHAEGERASQNGSQQNTPRANGRSSQQESQSQVPPTSSPLFLHSSPRGSQSQSQTLNAPRACGINISSPLRQQSAVASSDGGRTPRANGELGGEYMWYTCEASEQLTLLQSRRQYTTLQAPIQLARPHMETAQTVAALVSSFARRFRALRRVPGIDGTTLTRTS